MSGGGGGGGGGGWGGIEKIGSFFVAVLRLEMMLGCSQLPLAVF